jgi:serine/threonine protein kinase
MIFFIYKNRYSFSTDVWSMGCIFGELLFCCPLFNVKAPEIQSPSNEEEQKHVKQEGDRETLKKITYRLGNISKQWSKLK